MSVIALQRKDSRQQMPDCRKVTRQEQQQAFVRLTPEEIERLTEPGHRKRSSEICRELALKAFNAE